MPSGSFVSRRGQKRRILWFPYGCVRRGQSETDTFWEGTDKKTKVQLQHYIITCIAVPPLPPHWHFGLRRHGMQGRGWCLNTTADPLRRSRGSDYVGKLARLKHTGPNNSRGGGHLDTAACRRRCTNKEKITLLWAGTQWRAKEYRQRKGELKTKSRC